MYWLNYELWLHACNMQHTLRHQLIKNLVAAAVQLYTMYLNYYLPIIKGMYNVNTSSIPLLL